MVRGVPLGNKSPSLHTRRALYSVPRGVPLGVLGGAEPGVDGVHVRPEGVPAAPGAASACTGEHERESM